MAADIRERLIGLAAAALIALAPAIACADDNFFAGKTLTLIAGYPPGGGVDGEMRLVAKYLPRYVPGNPNLIAKNMPGAGGAILGNHLYNVAEKTGLVLGMAGRSSFLLSNVVPQKGISYDLAKFSYVGGAGSTNSILWLRKETGVKTVDDLRKAKKEIVLGALSPRAQNAIVPKVLAQYEGWPFRVVHGYRGFNDVLIAIERGEVDGLLSHEGSIQNTRPDMIETKVVVPVFQTFEELPGLPIMADIVDNPDEKALLGMLNAPSQIGLPVMGPPGVPEDRLAVLRAAYMKMVEDPGYRDEAEKKGVPVGRAISGPDIQKLIVTNLSNVPEAVVKEYIAYTEEKKE
ncbi:MAG: Bug family tripartite tricarboxylate transporter substrate binding protein [Gemmatimonas sp.]